MKSMSLLRQLFGTVCGFAITAGAAVQSRGPDVLFLNSYHHGLGWSDQVQLGVRASMGPNEQMVEEFLDSKHIESKSLDSAFASAFRLKYAHRQPRVLFASDDYSLTFVRRWRDSLFPGVPVVFCGINDFHPDLIKGQKKITGITQWNRMVQTAALITRLLPKTRDVWVVTEASATGRGNRRRLDSLAKAHAGALRFHFLDSAGTPQWSQLRSKVKSLSEGDVVYWSELFLDRDGVYIDPELDLGALVDSAKVPFFTHQASYLTAGLMGGDCNRGLQHGQQAGRLLRKVLDGVPADSLAVQEDSSTVPIFRWDAIQRFGVDPDLLPPGHVLLEKPVPVWDAYPVPTAAAVAGMALLGAMAALLSLAWRRARLANADFRRSQESLRHLFDVLPDSVFVFDEGGGVDFLNAQGCRMLGVEPGDQAQMRVADLFDGGEKESLTRLSAYWKQALGGDAVSFEWRIRRPADPGPLDVEIFLTALLFDGNRRIAALVRDVTDRVQVRELLLRSRDELEQRVQERTVELVQANRELEAFSYSVSHDLRTPLRGVSGFAAALEEELLPTLSADHRDYLHRIRTASVRMGEIIDSLLGLSRITMVAFRRVPVDMNAVVTDVIAAQGSLEHAVQWDIQDLGMVEADPSLVRVLWENLIGNAIKYTSHTISARVEIGTVMGDHGREWFVRDNGAGFDPTQAHNLFRPFRRLHGPEEFSGSGVGLAIVQRIVARHGGKVWAEGETGKGATFRFTLG
ncbi:MAG: PAS domain-containing protein [Fibrobacteres bacterium]|nr:PAS domain-containing protein [Fibrobacterota bacterium]